MFNTGKSISSRFLVILGVSLVTVTMMACSGPPATSEPIDSGNTPEATSPPATEETAATEMPPATEEAAATEVSLEDISSASFSDPISIDNEWFSLPPGKQLIIEGNTVEDGESIPQRLEFTVTGLTKNIDGIETVVVWIADYANDEIVESGLAFYAQADDGTVWYLGEHTEAYEEGELAKMRPRNLWI